MAVSSTFSNVFSFLSPPPKPPQQPHQFPSLARFPSHHHNHNLHNKLVPLVATRDDSLTDESSSVEAVTSSFPQSNTFQNAPFNVQVVVEDDEPEERVLERFRREVMRAGIIQECKRRRFHENKQDEKKRKTREAAKRKSRSRFPWRPRPGGRFSEQYQQDNSDTEMEEDDDDNWDLPEEDVLF